MAVYQIAVSSDDGRADIGLVGWIYSTVPFGWNNTYGMNLWLRFPNVNIPKRSVITSAYITMRVQSKVGLGGTANIFAEDAPSPSAPTTRNDYDGRLTTGAYVEWGVTASSGGVNSPSIVTILQEIVNKYNCSTIQFLIKGVGTGANFTAFRAVDGYPSYSAKLNVEFLPAAGGAGRLIGVGDPGLITVGHPKLITVGRPSLIRARGG